MQLEYQVLSGEYGLLVALDAKLRQQIVEITTREKPEGATHWSTRTLAAKLGTNHKFVSRVWRDNGLKPHLANKLIVVKSG